LNKNEEYVNHNGEFKKIGEVAHLLGTTTRTLRFYEEEGLIRSHRTAGGTRLYSAADIAGLRMVLQLVQLGISIDNIRKLITARLECVTGAQSSQQVIASLEEILRNLIKKKQLYEALQQDIHDAVAVVQQCHHCQNKPSRSTCPGCPINTQVNLSPLLYLIWESFPLA
jgi:DNA-binding transcriptional MerR regulator